MAIITLTRQSGSFGDEVGMLIARRLGYTYFDKKEILGQIYEKPRQIPEFFERDNS